MYREQVFWFSVVVIGLCESLDFNISGCVKDCNDQVFIIVCFDVSFIQANYKCNAV
jgi:hypothetical protein